MSSILLSLEITDRLNFPWHPREIVISLSDQEILFKHCFKRIQARKIRLFWNFTKKYLTSPGDQVVVFFASVITSLIRFLTCVSVSTPSPDILRASISLFSCFHDISSRPTASPVAILNNLPVGFCVYTLLSHISVTFIANEMLNTDQGCNFPEKSKITLGRRVEVKSINLRRRNFFDIGQSSG